MQATCIGCRDCKHYRGAQSITIASGTSCLQVAQKESRKRLVGDKALEKYALQFWGATARAAILATVAYATRNIHLTSHVTNSKGNCLFCGGAINRKSCRVIPPSDMPPRIGSLATRLLRFSEAIHLSLSFDSHQAVSARLDRTDLFRTARHNAPQLYQAIRHTLKQYSD